MISQMISFRIKCPVSFDPGGYLCAMNKFLNKPMMINSLFIFLSLVLITTGSGMTVRETSGGNIRQSSPDDNRSASRVSIGSGTANRNTPRMGQATRSPQRESDMASDFAIKRRPIIMLSRSDYRKKRGWTTRRFIRLSEEYGQLEIFQKFLKRQWATSDMISNIKVTDRDIGNYGVESHGVFSNSGKAMPYHGNKDMLIRHKGSFIEIKESKPHITSKEPISHEVDLPISRHLLMINEGSTTLNHNLLGGRRARAVENSEGESRPEKTNASIQANGNVSVVRTERPESTDSRSAYVPVKHDPPSKGTTLRPVQKMSTASANEPAVEEGKGEQGSIPLQPKSSTGFSPTGTRSHQIPTEASNSQVLIAASHQAPLHQATSKSPPSNNDAMTRTNASVAERVANCDKPLCFASRMPYHWTPDATWALVSIMFLLCILTFFVLYTGLWKKRNPMSYPLENIRVPVPNKRVNITDLLKARLAMIPRHLRNKRLPHHKRSNGRCYEKLPLRQPHSNRDDDEVDIFYDDESDLYFGDEHSS